MYDLPQELNALKQSRLESFEQVVKFFAQFILRAL